LLAQIIHHILSDSQRKPPKGIVSSIGISSTLIYFGGASYVVNDALVFTGGGGSGAVATVSTVATDCITSLSNTNVGTNYTAVSSLTATGGGGADFHDIP
jgi:hypothetical protein